MCDLQAAGTAGTADLPLPSDMLDVLQLNEAPRPQLRTLQLVLLGGGPWGIRLLEGAIAVGGFSLAFHPTFRWQQSWLQA